MTLKDPNGRHLEPVPPANETPAEALLRLLLDVLNERGKGHGPRDMERHGIDKATASRVANRRLRQQPSSEHLERLFAAYASASGETATALRDDWLERIGGWVAGKLDEW